MAGLADSAYAYWRRSIAIKEKADLNSNQTKLSLASAYLQRDNIKMAKSVIQSIDTTSFPLNSLEVKNEYLLINARIFRLDNSFEEAYEYSEQALKLAERSGNLDYLSSSLLELSKLYEISGKSSLSLSAYKRFYAARDSLLNIDRIEAVEKLKARYESDIQREEIRELEQQAVLVKVESQRENAIWFATVVVLILLLIVILFWYQRRVAQQKTKALHTNLKFLQSQLNPHFVYNSLTSLQRFVIENKSEDATIYISKFSRLMRQFLEHSREDYISIHEEMNAIKNYLLLQKIRYKEKFDYSVKLDNSPQREAYIPPMFAQPFVENAIEHGFKRSINNGEIEIVYEIKEDECIVTITDNGSGYQEKSRDNNHKSLATIITKERMDSLEKIYHKKITLDVTSSDSGTKVTLALPLKQSV